MLEAQEMFRTSNKVTRPEKALILGFMAGSRGMFESQCQTFITASRDMFGRCLGTMFRVIPFSKVTWGGGGT